MNPANYIIRIPEPCREDWNAMLPDEKGKFCNVCTKSVHDFSNKTDAEITKILLENKDQKVCGHFKKTQVNRPINITFNLSDLPKNISATKAFVIAVFLVFGSVLFSCTNQLGKTVGEIVIENPITVKDTVGENFMRGEIAAMPVTTIAPVTDENIQLVSYDPQMHVAGGMMIEYTPPDTSVIIPVIEVTDVEEPIKGLIKMVEPEEADSVKPQLQDTTLNIKITNDKVVNDKSHGVKKNEFIVYPNPTKGEFTVKYNLDKRSDVLVTINDAAGALVKTIVDIQGQHQGNYQIPVNSIGLPNGIYFVTLIQNGNRSTAKVIIEK